MTREAAPEMQARIDRLTLSILQPTKGEHPDVIFSSMMSALANFLAHVADFESALEDFRDGIPELETLTRRVRAKLDSGEEPDFYA